MLLSLPRGRRMLIMAMGLAIVLLLFSGVIDLGTSDFATFEKTYHHSGLDVDRSHPGFRDALASVAINNTVVVSIVDLSFVPMTINCFLTCFMPQKVTNVLIVTLHPDACKQLTAHGIKCYYYNVITGTQGSNSLDAASASNYDSETFIAKMNVRTDVILDVLASGYSLLHTDVDMICFRNPLEAVNCPRGACDISTMLDGGTVHAAGHDFLHPTPASVFVYHTMKEQATVFPKYNDQTLLNNAIGKAQSQVPNIVINRMSAKAVQSGLDYYEVGERYFAGDANIACEECVVVQNNWIVSLAAKVYRAKELHHWLYDGNEKYYTSVERKYLKYENPFVGATKEQEIHALRAALEIGRILKRIVILPRFHCENKKQCPLNSLIRIDVLDENFGGEYRESTFLTHPLVPEKVKTSVYGPVVIVNDYVKEHMTDVIEKSGIIKIKPSNRPGLRWKEVQEHFGQVEESVLRFHSLYDAFNFVQDSMFKPAAYRQYTW